METWGWRWSGQPASNPTFEKPAAVERRGPQVLMASVFERDFSGEFFLALVFGLSSYVALRLLGDYFWIEVFLISAEV